MKPLRVGVVGVGHLGKEHARVLASLQNVTLVGVSDVCLERAKTIASQHGTAAFGDYRCLVPLVDAVTIAVPTWQHHQVASEFLQHGLAVMVEKPLATNGREAASLVALAKRHGALLQVGHIERFNPTWLGIAQAALKPKYIRAERLGPYTYRSTDIGVVLDLMVHDLDLILQLVEGPVRSVEAMGVSVFGQHEDIVNARLTFEGGCIVDVTASRVSFSSTRRMQLWCAGGYVGLDFATRRLTLVRPAETLREAATVDAERLSPAEREQLKSKVFGSCLDRAELNPVGPEPLAAELAEFVRCVQTSAKPQVGGQQALEAIQLSETILRAVHAHQWDGHAKGPVGPFRLLPGDTIAPPHWDLQPRRAIQTLHVSDAPSRLAREADSSEHGD